MLMRAVEISPMMGAVGLDVDALAGVDIPDDFAVDDDLARREFQN